MLTEVEAQGTLLRMRPKRLYIQGKAVKHARGKVTCFSRKSRNRLIEKLARLDVDRVRSVFLTLTIHEIMSDEQAKVCLQRFRMRLQRKFPLMSAMWRKELQQRGAIHFHLICFNMPYWKQAAIQRAWEECTGEATSIVHVKLLRNKRQAMFYVSKYIAKLPSGEETTSLDNVPYLNDTSPMGSGRHWGCIRAALLPYAPLRRAVLLDAELEAYLRWSCKAISHYWPKFHNATLTCYTAEANDMIEFVVRSGGMWIESDNLGHYAAALAGRHTLAFVRSCYSQARHITNWKQATNRAYEKFQQDFLTRQCLSASMSYIDKR